MLLTVLCPVWLTCVCYWLCCILFDLLVYAVDCVVLFDLLVYAVDCFVPLDLLVFAVDCVVSWLIYSCFLLTVLSRLTYSCLLLTVLCPVWFIRVCCWLCCPVWLIRVCCWLCGDLNCDPVAVCYWLPGLLRPNLIIRRSGIKQDSTEIKNKNQWCCWNFIPGLMNRFIRFSNDFPPVFFALDYIYMYRTIKYDYNVIHRINASKQTRHTLIRNIDLYLASGLKWCFVKSCEYKCFKRSQSVRERKKKRKKKLKNLQLHWR